MILFRRSGIDDLDAIHQLSLQSGIGITTLPKDKELLQTRLQWVEKSFTKPITQPENEYYLFVLEDTTTKTVIGVSGIESGVGFEAPFYSYKLSKRTRICHSLGIRLDYELLNLVNDYQGCSELCTLYLNPDYRKNNNGLLLSRARFLFIAAHLKRFAKIIIAEMRGIADEKGDPPFWDNVGKIFFQMPFSEADALTLSTNKQFIADLMPSNSLYVKLLTPSAQAAIGKPHPLTLPAMNILQREGFNYNGYIDIFDGGPTLEAPITQIRTIEAHHHLKVKNFSDEVSSRPFLIANTHLSFRAMISHVIFDNNECILAKEVADILQVKKGDSIRFSPLHRLDK